MQKREIFNMHRIAIKRKNKDVLNLLCISLYSKSKINKAQNNGTITRKFN